MTHIRFFTSTKPIATFTRSSSCTAIYMGRMGTAVNRDRTKARGMHSTQMYTLSKTKVIRVLPPERRVKKQALLKPCTGMVTAITNSSSSARRFTVSVVL